MSLREIPTLGVGIGYRNELRSFYDTHAAEIEWFELVADRYFSSIPEGAEWLSHFREQHRLVPHGLDLSLGTDEPLDPRYSRQAAELVQLVRAPYYSDHLCMTQAGGIQLGHLTPLPFTRKAARRVADKAREIQQILGVPLLLENISYSFVFPGEMSEVEFVSEVIERADCGLLLDLTNLYINSSNHGYDPYDYLRRLPLERAVQVHLAGGERHAGRWNDTHSQPVDVHPEVWALLEYVARHGALKGVLLERDQNFPSDTGEIVKDLRHARDIFTGARDGVEPRCAPPLTVTSAPMTDEDGPPLGTPGAADQLAFQSSIARLLVEPALRARFRADPDGVSRELEMEPDGVEALRRAGIDAIGVFAEQLASKRFGLVNRSSPALYRLLERLGALDVVQRELALRRPPREDPRYASRTIRDAYWAQQVSLELLREGRLESDVLEDVAHFEETMLDLTTGATAVDSARSFEHAHASEPALSATDLLDRYPAIGPHVVVRRFGSQIAEVIRALMDGQPTDRAARRPTTLLFIKQVGLRNVLHFEINNLTERLLELCDGERTARAIVELLAAQIRSLAGPGGVDKALGVIRQLVERNAIAMRPSLEV